MGSSYRARESSFVVFWEMDYETGGVVVWRNERRYVPDPKCWTEMPEPHALCAVTPSRALEDGSGFYVRPAEQDAVVEKTASVRSSKAANLGTEPVVVRRKAGVKKLSFKARVMLRRERLEGRQIIVRWQEKRFAEKRGEGDLGVCAHIPDVTGKAEFYLVGFPCRDNWTAPPPKPGETSLVIVEYVDPTRPVVYLRPL